MEDNRSKTIYIACHAGNGLFGRVIRWATRGPYAHVSILFSDGILYEAREGKGVRMRFAADEHRGERVDLFALRVTPEEQTKARRWLGRQVGKGYDWLAIGGFVVRRGEQRRGSEGIWFCSELAAAMCQHIGRPLFRCEPYLVAPVWIARSPILERVSLEDHHRLTPAEPVHNAA